MAVANVHKYCFLYSPHYLMCHPLRDGEVSSARPERTGPGSAQRENEYV